MGASQLCGLWQMFLTEGVGMQIQVEFFGPIARGEWAQKEVFTRSGPIGLGDFLVSIGFLSEHLSHIIIVRNGSITKDMETLLADGDRLTLSVLLGGG
jgi:hypothetical protein